MPTFRNGGERPVTYQGIIQRPNGKEQEVLIIIDAMKDMALDFWLPYEELGLELVDADNPPVKGSTLLSGTFMFDAGTERKFTIGHCDKYILDVILQSGSVKVYHGNAPIGVEIRTDVDVQYRYHIVNDWEYAPYLRVVGLEDGTEAIIHAEVFRTANREADG